MKKFLLSFAFILMLGSLAHARMAGLPTNQYGQGIESSDYAGVDIATVSFSSSNVLLSAGDCSVIGFIASSNTSPTDYISIRSTGGVVGATDGGFGVADYDTSAEVVRVYLSSFTLGAVSPSYINQGMSYKFPAPIRMKGGATGKTNVRNINFITFLYHKFAQQ